MTTTHAFREAVEARDMTAIAELLHPEVQFRSPAVHTPYQGREACLHLLGHVTQVLEGFTYVDQLEGDRSTALIFRATVDGKDLEGLDHLTHDADGLITEFVVMIRPLSGLIAVAQAMGARLEHDPVP